MTSESETGDQKRWRASSVADGMAIYQLAGWPEFFDFIETEIFEANIQLKHHYIWRGQRRSDWSLSSSLDRLFGQLGLLDAEPASLEQRSAKHLDSFRYASRGRRGLNPASLSEWSEQQRNDLWALGQHFGLATPLLDWTSSPFAAAYFAFEELASNPTDYRVIFALNQTLVEQRNAEAELEDGPSYEQGSPVVEFVEPLTDENPRLVSQGGCFTRAPIGTPIEGWIAKAFASSLDPVLLRIEIPNKHRDSCLRTLNRMNINHLSLFPDLTGASRYTNLKLELEK
jgi:FRG domain